MLQCGYMYNNAVYPNQAGVDDEGCGNNNTSIYMRGYFTIVRSRWKIEIILACLFFYYHY